MPDPTKQTLSATQTPGLFGVSPYVTRWMLWQHFARGIEIDPPEDGRMSWGKKLQPLVLEQAAEDLKLEVRPNAADAYHRRERLGCTRDADIICPDRGPGALETKCVFDYRTWMSDWQGGKAPPRTHEIQLQQQMFVGDESGSFSWGVMATWVAGEVHYFEREPIPELWTTLLTGAAEFFASVKANVEPDPFGIPIELDLLTRVFPTVVGNIRDLTSEIGADKLAEMVSMYAYHREQTGSAAKEAERLRAQILAMARDAEEVHLPGGVRVTISMDTRGSKRIKVYVPDDRAAAPRATIPIEEILYAG
jgi:hypothetical protein